MKETVGVFVTCMCTFTMVTSFSMGPPAYDYICKEMFPMGHGVDAESSNPPFIIKLSQTIYQPWEVINVTINATAGRPFMGFFLQARRADCRHPDRQLGVGVFEPRTFKMKPIDCLEGTKNAVSHTSSELKNIVSVMWDAPGTEIGHIYFVATVVESRKKFWTNVYSNVLRDPTSSKEAQICQARMLRDPNAPQITTNDPTKEKLGSGTREMNRASSVMCVVVCVFLAKLNNM